MKVIEKMYGPYLKAPPLVVLLSKSSRHLVLSCSQMKYFL